MQDASESAEFRKFYSAVTRGSHMDARNMKKIIQYEALIALQTNLNNATDLQFEYSTMLDVEKVSMAQILRFRRVLENMIENAESKLD